VTPTILAVRSAILATAWLLVISDLHRRIFGPTVHKFAVAGSRLSKGFVILPLPINTVVDSVEQRRSTWRISASTRKILNWFTKILCIV